MNAYTISKRSKLQGKLCVNAAYIVSIVRKFDGINKVEFFRIQKKYDLLLHRPGTV